MVSVEIYRMRIGIFNYRGKKYGRKMYKSCKMNASKVGTYMSIFRSIVKLCFFLLIFSNFQNSSYELSNKMNHIKYGNRGNNSLKILHWNKGSSLFRNKIYHLKIVFDKYKPNVVSLSEANYDICLNQNNHYFLDYFVEFTDQKDNINMSRQILLIDKRLNYTRLGDLESKHDCTVWIEIKLQCKKSILFCGGYRQWQISKELGKNLCDGSKKINRQFDRYKSILSNWGKASQLNKDVIITMDDNLDDRDFSIIIHSKNYMIFSKSH